LKRATENAHVGRVGTFILSLGIDVNEINSLKVAAGEKSIRCYAVDFIWCGGSGGNANRRSFQIAK